MANFLLSTGTKNSLAGNALAAQRDQSLSLVAEPAAEYKLKGAKDSESERGVILVEAAGRDCVWGIGYGEKNPKALQPFSWRGQNLLGFALTVVRERLTGLTNLF